MKKKEKKPMTDDNFKRQCRKNYKKKQPEKKTNRREKLKWLGRDRKKHHTHKTCSRYYLSIRKNHQEMNEAGLYIGNMHGAQEIKHK